MRRSYLGVMMSAILFSLCAEAGEKTHVRGKRYCEVLLGKTMFTAEVYNTFGLNHCPQSLWQTMSKEKIKQDQHVSFVELNGPRYFMMDAFKNTSLLSKEKKSFNGISMRLAGMLHLNLRDFFNTQPYHPHEVERHTTWLYKAHRRVYELIDTEGKVYVMQSYSVQYVNQTQKSLENLGHRLNLPQGWRFRTGLLKKTSEVKAINDKAIVIVDEYRNAYQQATHDLLDES